MKIDVQTLGTFNQLAHEGAQEAAESLHQLTGIDPTVEATTVDLARRSDVISDFRGRDLVGVTTAFSDALVGTGLLVFDRAGAQTLVKNLPGGQPDSPEAIESRITEVGNILISGFIDGWANVLGTSISHSPPEFVDDAAPEILGPITGRLSTSQQYAFVFDSLVETTDSAITCEIFALPDETELREALDALDVGTAASDASLADEMDADPDDLF